MLADVRKLISHLPAHTRDKATWHYVAARLTEAAHGGETIDIALPLRMVISRRAMPPYHWASNECEIHKAFAIISRTLLTTDEGLSTQLRSL